MKLMYDSLGEDKAKLFHGVKIAKIVPLENGVKAISKDGVAFEGDIILGTDGVRSTVRTLMIDLARKANPSDSVWANEKPFTANYRAAFFYLPPLGLPGMLCETNQKDKAAFHFTGPERNYGVVMEKLPAPTTETYQYSPQETDDMVNQFAEYPFMEGFKVKDLYARKTQPAVILNIQEGIASKWSWGGRIVLAGDSCHKLTPNTGSGCNVATQDVAVLVNGLQRLVKEESGRVSSGRLEEVFEAYQAARYDLAKTQTEMSGTVMRLQLWANPIYYFVHNWLMKTWLFDYLLWNILTPREMRRGVVLDYVSAEEPFRGAMEWDYKIQ